MSTKAVITLGDTTLDMSDPGRHRGRARHRHRQAARQDGLRGARPGLHEHRLDHERDHLHRRREGDPPLPRHPHRAARREVDLRRDGLPAHLRQAAQRASELDRLLHAAHPALADPRGHEALLRRLPGDGAPHGHPLGDGRARCRASTRTRSTSNNRERAATSPSRACLAKVRTIAAFSYKKSIGQPFVYPQNSLAYCANFLNMMFSRPGRAVRDRRGHGEGAEPAPHPPRRSRAELLDLDGAPGRQRAGQPVRLDLARASAPSGARSTAAPTRRSIEMLERHPRRTAATSTKFVEPGQGQESSFRLMGFGHRVYKNYDPRAEDHQGRRRQGARASWTSTIRCSTSPSSWRRRRSRTVLRRAQALPQRRLLQRHHLPRARLPDGHVHRHVRPRPPARAGSPTGRR